MGRSRVWTSQPPPGTPIDWDNPLTDGLRFLYVPTPPFDLVGGRPVQTVGTAYSRGVGPAGVTTQWGGAGSTYALRDPQLEPAQVSWAAYTRRTGTIGNYARTIGKTYNNGTAAPYVSYDFEWNPTGSSQDSVRATSNAGGTAHATPIVNVPSMQPVVCVGTNNGALLSLYVNGRLGSSYGMNGAIAYDTSATGNLVISGSNASSAANEWVGDIYLAPVWGRILSPAQIGVFSANPWQIFHRRQRTYSIAASGGSTITGSASITEGADTASATGTLGVAGSGAITEGSDAVAATGSLGDSGTASISEQPDAVAATGALSVSGTASITEAVDAVAATGAAGAGATAAIVEGNDTASATGALSVSGLAAIVERGDIVVATGALGSAGTAAITEAPDTPAGVGALSVAGTAAIAERSDTVSATGGAGAGATAAITEGADSVSAVGTAVLAGRAAILESPDGIYAVGAAGIVGSAAITEGADIVYAMSQAPPQAACKLGGVLANRVTLSVTTRKSSLSVLTNQSSLKVLQ